MYIWAGVRLSEVRGYLTFCSSLPHPTRLVCRYVMITRNSVYTRIYKPHWIASMIAFSWIFSFLMQLPTLLGTWGGFQFQ
jgi:hypothetical protein